MQPIKQHKALALISILIVAFLIVLAVIFVFFPSSPADSGDNLTSPTPMSSPTATASPSPDQTTPTPTLPMPVSPTPTPSSGGFVSPTSPPSGDYMTNEISEYSGMILTPISVYIQYLYTHPDVAIKGVQNIDQSNYRLDITGMVDLPQPVTYSEVVDGFPSKLEVATLPCVEGWSVTMLWEGVPIVDLLNHYGISSEANTIIFIAADGYSSSLPLEYIKDNNLMIAYKMNNITLTPQLGWPFFLVATNQYGYKWVEWITEINVSNDTTYQGYWESRGYPNFAPVQGGTGSGTVNDLTVLGLVTASGVAMVVVLGYYVWRHRREIPQSSVQFLMARFVRRFEPERLGCG